MIRLINIVIVLGLVWSAYWYGAGYLLRQGVQAWFTTQQARGWQADYGDMQTSGYPLRHITTLNGPALADPATGTAWQADWLNLDSPAIWPGRQDLHFANTPQRLSYFDQTAVVTAQGMVARLHLHPGLALALERMELTVGPWSIATEGGGMNAGSLAMAMVQTDQRETYQFDIDATGFTPSEGLMRRLNYNRGPAASFETLTLDMAVRFDHVWDRQALDQRRPQPVQIDLRLAEARWGALRLMAAGKVDVDASGIPTGDVSIKAENWREMLDIAVAAGAIPAQAINSVEKLLGMLAGLTGNPKALDVNLTLRGGQVSFGLIPLGPAPRLILR